jgi:tRNA(Ile)-lysidine synthase
MKDEFVEKINKTISSNRMIEPGETVIVAVSGGADSVALLHALWQLKAELAIEIIVAHLNHGIRGVEADQDQEFVEELCGRLGIRLVVEKANVPALAAEMRVGIEEAARKVRYEFLQRVAKENDAGKIATAHTADDQVETVLLNIIRGCGLDGLSGMPSVRENIIRPLINIYRAEVESYLNENGLAWQIDTSNLSLDYTRNRVRHRLIPFLEEEFNPNVKKAVLSLSRLAKDESEAAQIEAERAFLAVVKAKGLECVVFEASAAKTLPRATLRRCLRMAIETVKGDLLDVEYEQVERIIEWLGAGRDFTLTLPSGKVYAAFADDELSIFRKTEISRVDFEHRIAVPGRTEIPELGLAIVTEFVHPGRRPENRFQAVMDASKLTGGLTVRPWRDGDRITPLGMKGQKKLQDMFVDLKIPQAERSRIPVITNEEKIVWVAGAAVSERVKITDQTQDALWVECLPVETQL